MGTATLTVTGESVWWAEDRIPWERVMDELEYGDLAREVARALIARGLPSPEALAARRRMAVHEEVAILAQREMVEAGCGRDEPWRVLAQAENPASQMVHVRIAWGDDINDERMTA